MKYAVVLHKDEGSDYGVTVPDVPGCFSAGETIDQALRNVVEALSMQFEGLVEDGEPMPEPQSIEHHRKDPDYADGIWALVEFDTTPYYGKAVRFNASLPEGLLKKIDDRVKENNSYASRSGFLAAAAMHELAKSFEDRTENRNRTGT